MRDGKQAPAAAHALSIAELRERIRELQQDGKVVGLCHGCFDILHIGHLRHFEAARAMVDALVVTVTPDRFVGKGPNRPVFSAEQRAELLAGLSPISYSAINEWPSAVEALERLRPDVFFKGQEYETRAEAVNPNFLVERNAAEALGIRVAFTHEETRSSTAAFQRLRSAME